MGEIFQRRFRLEMPRLSKYYQRRALRLFLLLRKGSGSGMEPERLPSFLRGRLRENEKNGMHSQMHALVSPRTLPAMLRHDHENLRLRKNFKNDTMLCFSNRNLR